MSVIEMHALTKYYGKARGILGVELQVEEGDYFGFIGPNGAGKSTTIRTLLGLISKSSGEARVLGHPVGIHPERYLADVGYMPGEAMLYSGMKVKDVIAFSAGIRKKSCEAEAKKLCERFNLDPGKRIDALSLGNRKKVSIICAMQHRPKLYILDEPTSGLDPLMQREFFSLLSERNREGATIFLSSHILSEIERNCSRAAMIKEGRLIVQGSVEALSKTGARRVTVHGISALPESLDAKNVSSLGDSVSFLYQGEIKKLLAVLADLPIQDVTITEPDLEEIFLHYYAKEGEA